MKNLAFHKLALLGLTTLLGTTSAQSQAQAPTAALAIPARPITLPGQIQPVAPGTLPAPHIPELTLTPPMAQLRQLQYLSNGHIEVASAVLLLTPSEVPQARALALSVVQRALAERPTLNEVDVSVYNKAGYGGFGGPLPLLTLSAPRPRLAEVQRWAAGASYERAWEASSAAPLSSGSDTIADKVRERSINFYGSVTERLQDAGNRSSSRARGSIQNGLLYGGNPARPITALTFDDAPHPMYEPLLLDLLRRGQVKATFFVIGRNARAYPYFVRDMVQAGHEVGNHTYHHIRLPPLPLSQASTELRLTNQTLEGITGQPVRFFRPPGGDYTPGTLSAARGLGLITVFWTNDPADFQNPGDEVLETRFERHLRPGGIVLLHDNAPQTLQVFDDFLGFAKKRGIALATVSEMLSGKVLPSKANLSKSAPNTALLPRRSPLMPGATVDKLAHAH